MAAKKVPSKSGSKSSRTPVAKAGGKPAGKASGKPASKPAKKAAARPAPMKALTKGASKAIGKAVARAGAKPAGKSAGKSAAKEGPKVGSKTGATKAKKRSFLADLDREMTGNRGGLKKPKPMVMDSGPAFSFAIEASRLLRDDKCEDVVMLDVREKSQVTDFVIIGSGTSERQMRSILHHVEEMGAKRGFQAFRSSTDDRASWVLVDFVHVVVHLFEPNTRAHYDLENLWPDAKRVQWERTDQLERDRAGLYA